MRGRIIFINPATNTGLIFGADRERYRFRVAEWTQGGLPARNTEVSFATRGDEALRIKTFLADDEDERAAEGEVDDPLAGLMPRSAAAGATVASAAAAAPRDKGQRIAPTVGPAVAPAGASTGFAPGAAQDREEAPLSWEENEDENPEDFDLTAELTASDPVVLTARGPSPLPPTAKILFSMDQDGARGRPTWQYYLIGLIAAILLLAIGFIITRIVR